MNDRRKILCFSISCMALIALAVGAVAIYSLYVTAFDQQRARLIEIAKSEARLIEAIARFDRAHSQEDDPGGATGATLIQITDAHSRREGFGQTGEFTLARREGDQIIFLLSQRHDDRDSPTPVPFHGEFAEPMRRALSGQSGTVVGRDYRGEMVLAAHEPVAELDLGIVAKIDLSEVRWPLVKALIAAAIVALALIFGGALVMLRVNNPLIKRLEQSEARQRLILEAAGEGIFGVDLNGDITFANPAAAKMLGWSAEELVGRDGHDLFHHSRSDGRPYPREECPIHNAFERDGRQLAVEDVFWRRGGSSFPVEYTCTPFRDEAGQITGAVAVFEDITERKRAEEAAREQARLLEIFFNSSLTSIVFLDRDFNFVRVNEAYARACQRDVSEFPGHNHFEFYPSDAQAIFEEARETKKPFQTVARPFVFSDHPEWGVTYWDWTLVPVLDENGSVELFVFSLNDVTERKRAELALQNSEQRLRLLLETTNALPWEASAKTRRFTYVGPQAEKFLGCPVEQWYEDGFWADHIHADDREWAVAFCQESSKRGEDHDFEYRLVAADRRIVWVQDIVSVVSVGGEPETLRGFMVDITERKRAEEERDRLFDLSMDMLCVAGFDGFFKQVNPAWTRTLGWTKEELLGRPWLEFVHPEDHQQTVEAGERLKTGKAVTEFENRYRCKDGTFRWMSWNAFPVTGEALTFCVIRDVTERKRAEDALRLDEARLEALVKLNDMAETSLREIGDFALEKAVQVTRSKVGFLGFMSDDESTMFVHAWSHDAMRDCDLVGRPIVFGISEAGLWGQVVLQRKPIIVNDYEALETWKKGYPEGHVPISRFLGIPVFDGERIVAVAAVANKEQEYQEDDVWQLTLLIGGMWRLVERRRVAEALQTSEQRFRAIADYTYAWEYWVGTDGGVIWTNPAVQRMTGYTVEECLEMSDYPLPLVHEDDREQVALAFKEAVAGSTGDDVTWRIRHRNGSVKWVAASWQPIFGDDDACLGHRGSVRDITARVHAEQRVREHQSELARLARLGTMGEMATGLAHELNQPLGAIINYVQASVETIRSGRGKCEECLADMLDAAEQAERAGDIISHMRDFVQKRKPSRTAVEINQIARDAANLMDFEARQEAVEVRLELSESQPSVMAEAIQIEQVVVNLIRNALEAMENVEPGKRQLIIRTTATEDGLVELAVRDFGTGLSEDVLEHVFDPFFTTKSSGMGMGLSICRTIVEEHGGRLWAERNPDQGVTFRFVLPRGDRRAEGARSGTAGGNATIGA